MSGPLPDPHIFVAKDHEALCEQVVRRILKHAEETLIKKDRFTLVLSGGSTPRGIYALMASSVYRDRFCWEKIHFFWGDERAVLPENEKSNYRMVSEALLTKVNIPAGNIHPIPTQTRDAETSARSYEETLIRFFGLKKGEFPSFDLMLLGLGRDGHTASLFPGHPALGVKDRLVVAVSQKGIPEERITLTLPVIDQAQWIFVAASGQDKADIVKKALENTNEDLPVRKIRAVHGKLWWFLDRASASAFAAV